MQEQKSFYWLYQPIEPVVQIEGHSSMYSQHLRGKGVQNFPTSFEKEEIFRGLLSTTPYWGDLDPKYSLWHIRHNYFAQIGDLPHFDRESIYLLLDNQSKTIVLVFFQMSLLGIVALESVTMLSPIWGHIVATVVEERQWCIR